MMAKAGRLGRRAAAAYRAYQEVTRPGSAGLGERLRAIPRMIRAAATGAYPDLDRKRLALLALGVCYLVSPIDVVPEFLALIGVVDDFGVLVWLGTALLGESDRYLAWERRRLIGRV
mgnify:CR=1 FL=1